MYDNEVSKNGFILWSRLLMLGHVKRFNGWGPFHDKDFVFHESKGVHGATSFKSHSTKQGVITDSKNDLTFALL